MVTKKTLIIISCSSAILTIILLMSLFKLQPSLSQYYSDPIAKYVFLCGFTISAIGFLTNKRTLPLFFLLFMVSFLDVYRFEVIHNCAAIGFFAYANYLMFKSYPSLFGYIMFPFWILLFFNILIFEIVGVVLIVSHIMYINTVVLNRK